MCIFPLFTQPLNSIAKFTNFLLFSTQEIRMKKNSAFTNY